AIDQLPGLGGHADLLVPTRFEPNAGRLAGLRVGNRDLRHVQRRFLALEAALRVLLGRLAVAGRDVGARHDHLSLFGHDLGDFTGAALVLTGQNHDLVALLDLLGGHHSTSGASEMIFICFRARSSRTTGPKIRVPIGSSFLFTSTAALVSKRITEPSGRRMSLAVRTITAR